MALMLTDGCDAYTSASHIVQPYGKWGLAETPWTVNTTGGINGGGCLTAATTGGGRLRTPSGINLGWGYGVNPGGVGFYMKVSAPPSSIAPLINTVNTDGAAQNMIRLLTNGRLAHYNGSTQEVFGQTNVCDNAWHWIEMLIGPNGSNTTQKCYVDSPANTQWNGSWGAQTSTNVGRLEFVSLASLTLSLDDIQIFNNFTDYISSSIIPMGPSPIKTCWPDGDSAVQFTRSGGATNASCVDEQVPDIADYVESGTSGHQDLYTFQNLGFTPSAVRAVMLSAHLSNPNLGSISCRQVAKSSATTLNGTTVVTPVSPMLLQQPFVNDPNGAIPWTGSAFDAALFGINIP